MHIQGCLVKLQHEDCLQLALCEILQHWQAPKLWHLQLMVTPISKKISHIVCALNWVHIATPAMPYLWRWLSYHAYMHLKPSPHAFLIKIWLQSVMFHTCRVGGHAMQVRVTRWHTCRANVHFVLPNLKVHMEPWPHAPIIKIWLQCCHAWWNARHAVPHIVSLLMSCS